MSLTVQIQGLAGFEKDINAGAAGLQREVNSAMVKSVNVVKNDAQTIAPFKTGTLRRSIYTQIQDNGFKGIVAQDNNMAPYGIYIEMGTKPHVIVPVNAKALFWKGADHPVRIVHHPGFPAKPFMAPALERNLDNIQKYFEDAVNNVVAIMAGRKF